jgi:hypothetical protein
MRRVWIGALLLASALVRMRADAEEVIRDRPFAQEYQQAYPLGRPGENDVRAVAVDRQGCVWAATAEGVRYLQDAQWHAPAGGDTLGSAFTLHVDGQGRVWVGAWNGLYRATTEQVVPAGIAGVPISAIGERPAGANGTPTLFAGGPDGIWQGQNGIWRRLEGVWGHNVSALCPTGDNHLWIAGAGGLYRCALEGASRRAELFSKPDLLLSATLYALAPDARGRLWIGGTGGLDCYEGTRRVRSLTTRQGLPNRHARALAFDADGRLWVATKLGVARYDGRGWSLRHSRRWLLSDDARCVAIGPDGTAWVATAAGVSAIRKRPMTLADKAAYFEAIVRKRHIRPPGLIGPALLKTPGDLTDFFVSDTDNDGEHTGTYCAAESYRYAVTKDPQALANAKEAFHALAALQAVTSTPHFIARTMIPIDAQPQNDPNRTYTPPQEAEERAANPRFKKVENRWLPSKDGKWLWKRDSSSDEVVGHMYGFTVYYDLAADAEERRRVAEQVDRLIGGIVDHGFTLQDIDGKPTLWGVWSPERLNGDFDWREERGNNSVEMLTYLRLAGCMTGKPRYEAAAKTLIAQHGYLQNALLTDQSTPSERTHIVYELLSCIYPILMTHETDPERRKVFQQSIERWHGGVRNEGIAVYDFVYNRWSGRRVALAGAAEMLRDWPLDLIEWTVDNRAREDVDRDDTPGNDDAFLKRILPRSEMGICNPDQEPQRAVIGNDGRTEDYVAEWLNAYWIGRYYGFITPPMPAPGR